MKKLILLSLLICAALSAAELRIVRQPANGQCKLNEESEFKIVYSGASAKSVSVAFLGNGVTEKVTLPLEKANGEITLKRTMNVPGNLICTAEMAGAKKAVAGTLFAPEKIFAISPAPSDFDASTHDLLMMLLFQYTMKLAIEAIFGTPMAYVVIRWIKYKFERVGVAID